MSKYTVLYDDASWRPLVERSDYAAKHGIPNKAPARGEALAVIVRFVEELGFRVTSAYRSKQLNKAVGGAPRSAHLECRALDLVAPTEWSTPGLKLYDFLTERFPTCRPRILRNDETGHFHLELPGDFLDTLLGTCPPCLRGET